VPGPPQALFAAKLLLQPRRVDEVPVLGELAVFDAPDIDGSEREAPPGRGDSLQRLGVRRGEGISEVARRMARAAALLKAEAAAS
jgi:hypothetical protein